MRFRQEAGGPWTPTPVGLWLTDWWFTGLVDAPRGPEEFVRIV